MDTILEWAPWVHVVTVVTFLLMLIGASQFRHEDFFINAILRFTGLSVLYSAYHLFTLEEDDPRYIELEAFKKVAIYFGCSLSISLTVLAVEYF